MRPTTLLTAGGTIAMVDSGSGAGPALDAAELARTVGLEVSRARSIEGIPGAHRTLDGALTLAREAVAEAEAGSGVVITTGTDTLEEQAVLLDVLNGAEAPIVLTGAIRPASSPGADGPANLVDALAVAREAPGGTYVVFAGEIHAALHARKTDSTSPRAFGSPQTGPLGAVAEGRVAFNAVAPRLPPLAPARVDFDVPIVATWLGDHAELLRAAFALEPDALVLVALGAGHVGPPVLEALREAPCPVVATVRPGRGQILHETYGFAGAEPDLRAVTIAAGGLSPQAARMVTLAALGSGLRGEKLAAVVEARG